MPESLDRLDKLIADLEEAIRLAELADFTIEAGGKPNRATVLIKSGTLAQRRHQKPMEAEVTFMKQGQVRFRCTHDIVRGYEIELTIAADKTGEGETTIIAQAVIDKARKISGGYDFEATIQSIERKTLAISRRFMDFVLQKDAPGWNRWCAEMEEGANLRMLDLQREHLANFDLCCADLRESDLRSVDLTGANLSGANLTGCRLDGASVAGADFFRTRLPRKYMHLLVAAGLVEVESVILVD